MFALPKTPAIGRGFFIGIPAEIMPDSPLLTDRIMVL
jgi:hypothetical protein